VKGNNKKPKPIRTGGGGNQHIFQLHDVRNKAYRRGKSPPGCQKNGKQMIQVSKSKVLRKGAKYTNPRWGHEKEKKGS